MTYTVYLIAYKNKKFKISVKASSIIMAGEKAILRAPKGPDWSVSMIWYNFPQPGH
jgi:hypothetical protein